MIGESTNIKKLLKGKDILDSGTVEFIQDKQAYRVQEPSYQVTYSESAGCWTCSCSPYYSSKFKRKYTCKHIAAVQLLHDRENRAFLLSKPAKMAMTITTH